MIRVLKPGFFSTIQDAGRIGFQQYGVIVSGVMDEVAYRLGNALLKQRNTASIEMTLIGGTFTFTTNTLIVMTGATMLPTLNGKPISMNKVIAVKTGDTLVCGPITNGVRSYLAVKGGILVEEVMKSRSTYIKAGIGGFKGRALAKGDELPIEQTTDVATAVKIHAQPFYDEAPIRILKGTEWNRFDASLQQSFITNTYTISLEADRMGYRILPASVNQIDAPFQLISEAVTFGTIQMPPNGEPIILMADRQTTGGYPKIGQVIAADLHRLAQLGPKQSITFEVVSVKEAEQAYMKLQQHLETFEHLLH